MDDKALVKTMANTFTCTLMPKMIALAKQREPNSLNQSLLVEMEEAISNEIAKKTGTVYKTLHYNSTTACLE